MPATDRADALAASVRASGVVFESSMQPAARYALVARHDGVLYLSGQLPRTADGIAVTGTVGDDLSLEEGRRAASICALRSLLIVGKHLGSLDSIAHVLKMTVYVRSNASFTQHSAVADAASNVLYVVLGTAGAHARTAVGVASLPGNAAVEIDLVLALEQ